MFQGGDGLLQSPCGGFDSHPLQLFVFFPSRRNRVKGLIIAAIMATALVSMPPPPTVRATALARIVYVIESFNDGLYHKLGCCSLYGQSVKAMTRSDARRERRQPCDWCYPDTAHKKGWR